MEVVPSSSTYTVLARRYRPQGFEEVIGQEHVATSLRNAILAGRVAHAYLFTGARGVGKTSTARILAKALNCPNAVEGAPCNHCDTCEGIAAGRDVDVLEIDGASNRGIDDIRQLRANVSVKSMRSQYKIYIIDEVHMLTKEAFNALLKTLEEPPPNVKFVFCTTEPNKVPDTILSRCQRFDFGTIALTQIIERLASIALAENMEVEPAALELVARRAAGSMRDSQSIFDQLLASADKRISAAEVHRLLGTASDERLIELFAAIISRQRAQTLTLFSQALADGAQLGEFTDQILVYLRDLMVLAAEATNVPLLSVSENNRAPLTQQAQSWGLNTIVAALQIISEAKLKVQRVTFGRAIIELSLIRLTLLEQLQSLDALLSELTSPQMARLAAPVTTGGNSANTDEKKKPEPIAPTTPQSANWSEKQEGNATTKPRADEQNCSAGASMSQNSVSIPPLPEKAPVFQAPSPSQVEPPIPVAEHRNPSASEVVGAVGNNSANLEDSSRSDIGDPGPEYREEDESSDLSEPPVGWQTPPATTDSAESSVEFCSGAESAFWTQVLAELGDDVGKHFRKVVRTAICGPNRLELVFPKSYLFAKQVCEKVDVRNRLEEVVFRLARKPVQILFSVTDDSPADDTTSKSAAKSTPPARRLDLSSNGDSYVDKVVEIFNAKIMKKDAVNRPGAETD